MMKTNKTHQNAQIFSLTHTHTEILFFTKNEKKKSFFVQVCECENFDMRGILWRDLFWARETRLTCSAAEDGRQDAGSHDQETEGSRRHADCKARRV